MDRLGGIVQGHSEDPPPSADAGCEVLLSRAGDGAVAVLRGDLDTSSAFLVERVLDEELRSGPSSLVVSLEGLRFLDSSGLRVLLVLQRNAQRLGVPISFARPQGAVRRTLDFSKALDYLGITDA